MPHPTPTEGEDVLALIDFTAIADPGDKVRECEFFLHLAEVESERERFRWLVTAYLNAVYSYFEISALATSVAITDPLTAEPVEDTEAVERLRNYVSVSQRSRDPYFVKTTGVHPIVNRLYKVRRTAAHRGPLTIMAAGENLPEDYAFGDIIGEGTNVLAFCREALVVVKQAQSDLSS